MNENPPLIIDKCFAHSASHVRLSELAESYTILVPSAFFYEVARTSLEKRRKAISYFPEFQMLHIPSLLRREIETAKPLESLDYQAHSFNPDFVTGKRAFDETEENIVKGYEDTVLAGNLSFWKQTLQCGVFGFTEAEMEQVRRGTMEQFTLVCKELLDVERVRRLADGLGSQSRIRSMSGGFTFVIYKQSSSTVYRFIGVILGRNSCRLISTLSTTYMISSI